ncbi:MAG: bacteriohopanetetrol glucosamine biosynthesis glycosyltransferase HpnI [Acidobacteriaceae bacterium]|nr:bacteriohopanetetrol glucosamine biosynthesis glycosyltransferase HpnI [Acidobacteriaceae bacterium]
MHLFWLIFLPAFAYQVLAIFAALRHLSLRRKFRSRPSDFQPGVSVLKPLRGIDPNTSPAFISQIQQNYPEFEVLFGASSENDPAALEVRRLQMEFPKAPIRLIIGGEATPNGKVGVLMNLAPYARHPVWVINDSDIKVTSEYLSQIVGPLADAAIGVVTCPYRAQAHTVPAAWESLGIATDFMPSALVAQLIGVREFGFGSTLAFRAADLEQAGGFGAIADYLADDYQLAKRITALGKRALLSTYTVETSLGDASWTGTWQHQLRWARTIRICKGGGYAGLPITQAGVWALAAVASGAWWPAAGLLIVRCLSAALTGRFVLQSKFAGTFCWLAPVWDLYAWCVWAASYAGRTVRWRDRVLAIDAQGRIRGEDAC